MQDEMKEVGERLRGLREACDASIEEMAADLNVSRETYASWEETGADVPVSAIYHIARKFGVELTEILTGTAAKLTTYQVVRAGEGHEIDRYPGYHYEDMAWRFANKIMQPMLVIFDPSDEPAELVAHSGQEFNLVLEGSIVVTWGDKEFILNTGDCMYFDPTVLHGQRCYGDKPATFISMIAE